MKLIFFCHTFSEQWWCTEYAEDIHDVLRKREYDRFGFESKAPQIKWRAHIIQYMLGVAQKMRLARTTLHLGENATFIFYKFHKLSLVK